MYKLLIVDDEVRIRTGLAELIEWEVYGIEICGLAEDGMKAWLKIKNLSPDIVLVDISMPNMSGLELIELCTHIETTPKFIILSGYNDFEYVRKAIQFGAVDYLLKPVDQDELIHAVNSCVKHLDKKNAHQQQFQESIQTLRNDLLMRVLHQQITPHEFREKCKVVDVSLHCSRMRVGVFALVADGFGTLPSLSFASSICQDICSSLCSCYVISDVNTNITIIFKDMERSLTENDYLQTLSQCSDTLSERFEAQGIFSLGREVGRVNELPNSYNDCIAKLEKKLILGDNLEDKLSKSASSAVSYEDFIESLEKQDESRIRETLHSCFRRFLAQENNPDINLLKYHLIDLTACALRSLYSDSYFSAELEKKKLQVFSMIRETNSIIKLEDKLTLFFTALATDPEDLSETSGYPHMIQLVLAKIRTDYSDNTLSLKTIAAQMDVNPAYLGREFAEATGEYFNDFLNRIRISKAIHLLNTTPMKTVRIAESVGFTNSSYFFTVFKKITGKSPSDYRTSRTG